MARMTITSADRTERGVSKRCMHRIIEKKDKHIRARDVSIGELKAMLYEYGELSKHWNDQSDKWELAFIKERKKVIILSAILIAAVIGSLVGVILHG